jgi:hypothetical protein
MMVATPWAGSDLCNLQLERRFCIAARGLVRAATVKQRGSGSPIGLLMTDTC